MARNDLTAERLRAAVIYCPETGSFIWKHASFKAVPGRPAGRVSKDHGYLLIGVDNSQYRAQRLAWLYVYGKWPDGVIDHVNGDRLDNRLCNLRDVPRAINNMNRHRPRRNSRSGMLGVQWFEPYKKWKAEIQVAGKRTHIGYLEKPEDAQRAYQETRQRLHASLGI